MSIRVLLRHNLEIPMSTSVKVNESSASANLPLHGGANLGEEIRAALSTTFPSPQDRTIDLAERWTMAAVGLLGAVGLVLFVVGTIKLNSLVGPGSLPSDSSMARMQ
jgi:hypothetical protein